MFRRIFKRRAARTAEKKAKKQQEQASRNIQLVFRKVQAEAEHGILQTTRSEDATEFASTPGASILTSGTYSFPSDESGAHNHEVDEEIREMKIVLDDMRTVVAEKEGKIIKQKEEISKLQKELSTTKTLKEEVIKLRKELCNTKTELGSIKSTLAMKQLELKARQQDVLDKDISIQRLQNKQQNDDPIHNVVSFGMHIVGHLPFIKL